MITLKTSCIDVLLRNALLLTVCFPTFLFGQSDTTEFRPGDAAIANQFDERARIQQVNAQQINPRLLQILKDWENTTKNYKKLSGEHRRFVYDTVFQVEKRADGKFYYEAPDKGRIDIKEIKIPSGSKSQKLNPQGKPFALQSDIPEIWICDGKRIAQAIVSTKQYQIHEIPKQNQGINIMDGPLPFLFGLPADKAVERYDFVVLPQTDDQRVWLKILPKRKQDAANWREAQVILDRKSYLPIAVRLTNPAGTTETVYSFQKLKVNGNVLIDLVFGRDPFNIEKVLKGYKLIQQAITQPEKPLIMPAVLNQPWKPVKSLFEERGFEVEFRKAGPASKQDEVFKIAKQDPTAGSPLKKGQKVIFFLYDEIKSASKP